MKRFLLACLCFVTLKGVLSCINSENIECYCSHDAVECFGTTENKIQTEDLFLNISKLHSSNNLKHLILNVTHFRLFTNIRLSGLKFTHLSLIGGNRDFKNDSFGSEWQGLKWLSIQNSNGGLFENRFFLSLHHLTELYLESNGISEIEPTVFLGLKELEVLSLSKNQLIEANKELLQHLPKLQTLVLNNNNITHVANISIVSTSLTSISAKNCNMRGSLEEDSLSGAINLTRIDFSSNQIENINSNALSALVNLKVLDVSNNIIHHLGNDAFSKMPHLETLDLSNNKIIQMKTGTFTLLPLLKNLNLSSNLIKAMLCDYTSALQSLESIDLRHNEIRIISPGTFLKSLNMKELLLEGNMLDETICISNLTKYADVVLSDKECNMVDSCIPISTEDEDSVENTVLDGDTSVTSTTLSKVDEDRTVASTTLSEVDEGTSVASTTMSKVDEDTSVSITTLSKVDEDTSVASTTLPKVDEDTSVSSTTLSKVDEDTEIQTKSSYPLFTISTNFTNFITDSTPTTVREVESTTAFEMESVFPHTNTSTTEGGNKSIHEYISSIVMPTTTGTDDSSYEMIHTTSHDIDLKTNNVTILDKSTLLKEEIKTETEDYSKASSTLRFDENTTEMINSFTSPTDTKENLSTIQVEIKFNNTDYLYNADKSLTTAPNLHNSETETDDYYDYNDEKLTSTAIHSTFVTESATISDNAKIVLVHYTVLNNTLCVEYRIEGVLPILSKCVLRYDLIAGKRYFDHVKCPPEGIQKSHCRPVDMYRFCFLLFIENLAKGTPDCHQLPTATTAVPHTTTSLRLVASTESTDIVTAVPVPMQSTTVGTFIEFTDIITTSKVPKPSGTDTKSFKLLSFHVVFNDSISALAIWTVNRNEILPLCNLTLSFFSLRKPVSKLFFVCSNYTYPFFFDDNIDEICISTNYKWSDDTRCKRKRTFHAGATVSKQKGGAGTNNAFIALGIFLLIVIVIIIILIFRNLTRKRLNKDRYNVYFEEQHVQKRLSSLHQDPEVRFSFTPKE